MNKSILIKGSIIMGIFLVIIGAAVGCSMIKKDDVEPQISNGDNIYLELSDFDITKQELWKVMKDVDGLDYLIEYVDELILEDYINSITQQEIDDEILMITYLTDDLDTIAEIQADEEANQEYINSFRQNLTIMGYDPDNLDDLRAFVELNIAKLNMVDEHVRNAQEGSPYLISETSIEYYYNQTVYNDACVLEIRFSSVTEATLVFDHFNLVPNFDTGFGEYFGALPIEDVATDDFNVLNTKQLTDEEVFSKYVELYNYMNPWMDPLPTDITQEEYCTDYSDIALMNFDDMTKSNLTGDPNIDYALYIFNTLDLTNEETIPFSYNVQPMGDMVLLAYKVSEEERTPFEDLTAHVLGGLIDDLVETFKTSEVSESLMAELRAETKLEIFDPYLKLSYEFSSGITFDNNGSETLMAKFGDVEITADDLYEFMEGRVGTFYSIEITKVKRLVLSDAYEDMYGTNRDYMSNASEKMIAHREELRTMKATFGSNGYESYGFSSNVYTWEEFLYLAFSARSENDVMEQLFVVGSLQPSLIYPTLDYDSVSAYIQDQVDNYFSLNVIHILMYVDFDKDFMPDSFDDLRDNFKAADVLKYNNLKVDFENLILRKYNIDELTTEEIVTEYKDSLIDDVDNEWAIFKQYGFMIMTEAITLDGSSLNYLNTNTLDENFQLSLKRIYDLYVRPENKDMLEYTDSQLTVSDFGLHLIIASPGSGFEQPSAAFTNDPLQPGAFSEGSENVNMTPSESQILLYNEIKFASLQGEQAAVILPSVVYAAIEAYYLDMFNTYFTQTGYSLITAEYMLNSSPEYTDNDDESIALLEEILAALYDINFPDGYVITTD